VGCLSKYYWVLRRAKREYKCSRCKAIIKPGELYVYYFGVGMGTNCRVEKARYCLSCAEDEIKEMLIHNVRRLVGSDKYPAKDEKWRLPESWHEEILRRLPNIVDEMQPQQPWVRYGLKYEEKGDVIKVSYSKPGLYKAIVCSPSQCAGYYIDVDGNYSYLSLSKPDVVQEVRSELMEIGHMGDNEQARMKFTELFDKYFNITVLINKESQH